MHRFPTLLIFLVAGLMLFAVLSCNEESSPNSPARTTADRLQSGWWMLDCPECNFNLCLRFLPDGTLQEVQWTNADWESPACAESQYSCEVSLLQICEEPETNCQDLVISWCTDEELVVFEYGNPLARYYFRQIAPIDSVFAGCGLD